MDLKSMAAMILTDIDCHVVRTEDQRHRNHLGASEIGDECLRKLWFKFRWYRLKKFGGRMLRLFERGNREEEQYVKLLRQAGWTVWDRDPETGKQFTFSDLWGHFGGSMDAIGVPPPHSKYAALGPVVLEFKTIKESYFKALQKKGVKVEQKKHWTQMHLYGVSRNIKYAVYLNVNKNDEELYCEILPIDPEVAKDMRDRAYQIIFSGEVPPRVSDDPTFYLCKMCDFAKQCHYNHKPDHNCRSCKNARPVENAEWWCNKHQKLMTREFMEGSHECWEAFDATS